MHEYLKRDADIRTFLENVQKGKYLREHMLDESIFQSEDDYYLLFVTEQHIVYISIKEKYVIWEVNTSQLREITKSQNGLTLSISDGSEVVMLIPDQEDIDTIYKKLEGVKEITTYLQH